MPTEVPPAFGGDDISSCFNTASISPLLKHRASLSYPYLFYGRSHFSKTGNLLKRLGGACSYVTPVWFVWLIADDTTTDTTTTCEQSAYH